MITVAGGIEILPAAVFCLLMDKDIYWLRKGRNKTLFFHFLYWRNSL
ncbi:hypothetical protein HMPREF9124_2189 [Oribacterium sp. oral taxon 108 str. F0425]|nr:hypothetical protein HMPREF9124_2189 [Oribacterium sp. oral taxon 108 str. F0425]